MSYSDLQVNTWLAMLVPGGAPGATTGHAVVYQNTAPNVANYVTGDYWVNIANTQAVIWNQSTGSAWAVTQKYLALHYGLPPQGGVGQAEVVGGAYVRQILSMQPPQSRSTYNNTNVTFTNLPAVTVAFLGIWDNMSGGNLVGWIPVTPTAAIPNAGTFSLNGGDLGLTFN